MDEYACKIGRYDRTQGVKQSVCLSSIVLSSVRRPPDLGNRAIPKHNIWIGRKTCYIMLWIVLIMPTSVLNYTLIIAWSNHRCVAKLIELSYHVDTNMLLMLNWTWLVYLDRIPLLCITWGLLIFISEGSNCTSMIKQVHDVPILFWITDLIV